MRLRFSCKILLSSILLLLASCRDHPATSPPSPTPEGPHLRGKVINWALGDTLVTVAEYQRYPYTSAESIYVFGTSAIDKDGNFYLPLSTPPPEVLRAFIDRNWTFSDTAAKFVMVYGLDLRNPDGTHSQGVLMNATVRYDTFYSDSSKPGDYLAYFVYADRDVEMTGTGRANVVTGQVVYLQYHLSYKKGWNRIVQTVTSNQAHRIDVEATIVNVDAGNWYVE